MPKTKITLEGMWLAYVKSKYPSLVIGSQEYDHRRHCFYVGVYTLGRVIATLPDSIIEHVMQDLHAEVKAELTRNPNSDLTLLNKVSIVS